MFGNSGNCKKKEVRNMYWIHLFEKKQQEYFRNIPFFLFQIKTTGAISCVAPHLLLIGNFTSKKSLGKFYGKFLKLK